MNIVKKTRALVELLRPELPLAAGICVVAGEIIASTTLPSLSTMLLGFLTGIFISGAAMATNDYFDLEVDRVNHPQRPLPSGRVTVPEIAVLTILLTAAGLLTAALLSTAVLALAAVMWLVAQLYNWRFKETGLPGNLMVAFCVGMTFVCGGVAAGGLADGLVWAFGAMAFAFDLGEEIAAGALDAEGDAKRGARSVAIVHGKQFATSLAGCLFVLLVVISAIPFVAGWLGSIYLAVFVPLDLALLYLTMRLMSSRSDAESRSITRTMYLAMTFFVLVFVVLRAA